VVVSARWEGAFTAGPKDVVEPLANLLAVGGARVDEVSAGPDRAPATTSPGSEAVTACKTSEQRVYMYGIPGPLDQLTTKSGRLTFCWNGSQAWATSQSGGCTGNSYGLWQWVIDGCWTLQYVPGPAWDAYREGKGSYHCSPPGQPPCWLSNPDGYYHSLFEWEHGYGSGASACLYAYTGLIVNGVGRTILQGCS
jgi:hypothetical protein